MAMRYRYAVRRAEDFYKRERRKQRFQFAFESFRIGRCEANGNSVVTNPQKNKEMNCTNFHEAHEVFEPIQLVRIRAIRVF